VNDIEIRLRDAYRGATDTVRPEAIRGLGEHTTVLSPSARWWTRGTLHRWMVPLSAAAAMLVIGIVAAVVVPDAWHDARNQAGKDTAPLAGNPATHFLVGLADNTANYLSVRSAITGAAVATLAPPAGRFFGPAATGDGVSYIVAAAKAGACGTWLYRFTISRTGQPSRLTPYWASYVSESIEDLALSRNGRTLAFSALTCARGPGGARQVAGRAELGLLTSKVTSKTSYTTTVTYSPVPRGEVVNSLSLTADGRQLEFSTDLTRRSPSDIYVVSTKDAEAGHGQRGWVLLNAARFGASAAISDSVMTPDGSTVYFSLYQTGRAFNARWALRAVDVATGRSRLITEKPGYGVHIVASPSARQLIAFVQTGRPRPPEPIGTPSPSPSPWPPSPSGSPSPVPSVSPSGSPSPVPSVSPSDTPSPVPTVSPSSPEPSPSVSPTPVPSVSPSSTPSPVPTTSSAVAALAATLDAATEPFEVLRIQLPGGRIRYLNPVPWDVGGLFYVW
jgi:hypothetical protein